jgi:hypothetical protein
MKIEIVWVLLRLVVIAVVTAGLLSIPAARSNLDWGAGVFIGVIISVALYLWLMAAGSRADMDLSLPYSFKQPFLPMRKFPLRYWFVVSYALVIGGAVAVACAI